MQTKQRKEFNIATDTFWMLSFAHLIFLGIMLLIYLGVYFILIPYFEGGLATTHDFLTFTLTSAYIYMLIMGIIGAYYYFPMYVQFGVTRKKTFIGTILGLLGGAISFVILAGLLSGILQLIFNGLGLNIAFEAPLLNSFMEIEEGTALQGSGFLAQNTLLAGASRLGITLISYAGTITLWYVIGWMVGTAFYRSGVIKGIGFILLALFIVMFADLLWGNGLLGILPRINLGASIFSQWFLALIGTVGLIAVTLWIIRALTKRITIKLN